VAISLIRTPGGDAGVARRLLSLYPQTPSDVQERIFLLTASVGVLRAEGRLDEALAAALECLGPALGTTEASVFATQYGKQVFPDAVEILLALGRREQAAELVSRLERLPGGFRPPFVEAQACRLRARLDDDPAGCAAAAAGFAELGMPFWAAVAWLEQAELLDAGEETERLLADARETFQFLRAKPWLDRVDAALAGARTKIPA
jgi:hypothetical protein